MTTPTPPMTSNAWLALSKEERKNWLEDRFMKFYAALLGEQSPEDIDAPRDEVLAFIENLAAIVKVQGGLIERMEKEAQTKITCVPFPVLPVKT